MHSSVFEISHAPVPAAKWPRAGNLPDCSMSRFVTMPRTQTQYRGKMLSASFAGL